MYIYMFRILLNFFQKRSAIEDKFFERSSKIFFEEQ